MKNLGSFKSLQSIRKQAGFLGFIKDVFLGGAEKKASKVQQEAYGKAGDYSLKAAKEIAGTFSPYQVAGEKALTQQAGLLGLPGYDKVDFTKTPGYEFILQEGTNALNKRAAATGTFYSGKPMRELARYSAGLASQEFGDYFNRLAGISNTGFNATTNAADINRSGAQDYSQALIGSADARASGILGKSQAIKSTIFDVGKMLVGA